MYLEKWMKKRRKDLALRFLIYQYRFVYHLNITEQYNQSVLVYGFSWVVILVMLLVMKAEVSIMKMSRPVADIESSSNREVALLEQLEDEQVPKSHLCLTTVLILDATLRISGSSMAIIATDCRGGLRVKRTEIRCKCNL